MLTAFLQYLGFVASWNASRCRNFTVSIIRKGTDFSAKMGPNMPSMRYLWEPPVDVPVLDHKLAHLACVVIVPLVVKNWRSFSRIELESLPKHVGSLAWSGGRNVVIVDQSDAPITFYHRAKYALGDALVAQSHAESDEFIHGFDISIPIGFSPGGSNSPQSLQPLLHKPPKHRRYWLSFRGAMSMERTADGIQRHSLLWLQAINRTDRGRVGVYMKCFDPWTAPTKRPSRAMCAAAAKRFDASESYAHLLDTVFHLCPTGRSPASYRMNEALAAGAIPIFVSGDVRTGAPYVPPFSDVIDWPAISLHFHAQQAGHILDALDALSDATIERMQAGVRHAWHQHLRPGVANTSFYAQLRRRVSFADAPTAGFSEELREWAMARTETVKTMRKPQEWAAQLRSLSNGSAHAWAPGGALSMGLLGSLNPGNRSCGTYRGKEYCVEL